MKINKVSPINENKKKTIQSNIPSKYERDKVSVIEQTDNIKSQQRPSIHFTPQTGWINDPNGLIYVDGVYHLFFQHFPNDTKWGPMHWGHATSTDLISWEHQPIALYPTENGYVFSGSAILDTQNIMQFSDGTQPVMLAFYTEHNPKTGEQMQCMAYSRDYIHFEKYEGNPIIPNYISDKNYKKEFRDPKVFVNTVKGGYSMILAVDEAISFYHSVDLIHWEYTGSFIPKDYGYVGMCECPDLFAIKADCGAKYILSMSMVFTEAGAAEESHIMQYFVGEFDGNCFVNTQPFEKNQLLDFGKDNYAMVSFSGMNDTIMMGWGEDWNVARKNSAKKYFGKMTLARKLELIQIAGKYRLKQKPIYHIEKTQEDLYAKSICLKEGQTETIDEFLVIKNEGTRIWINSVGIDREMSSESHILIICDCGYYEIYIDEGLIVYSMNRVGND